MTKDPSFGLIDQRVNEMKDLLKEEANSRMELSQFMEAYHATNLKTNTDFRNDLKSLFERVDRLDYGHTHVREAHLGMQEEHQQQKRIWNEMSLKTREMSLKIDEAETQLEQLKDVHGLMASITAERSARAKLERQLEGSMAVANQTRLELRTDIDIVLKKLSLLETMAQEQQASFQEQQALKQESANQDFRRELFQLRALLTDESRLEAQEARVEVLETAGSLDAFKKALQALMQEFEKEREARALEASKFQSGLGQLQEKLQVTVENQGQYETSINFAIEMHESSLRQLQGSFREFEKQTIPSARSESEIVKSPQTASELLRARLMAPRSEGSFQSDRGNLGSFQPSAAQEVGWKKQAVSDVEHIRDDLSHMSPCAASSNSMLPTLATALRLSKAGEEAKMS